MLDTWMYREDFPKGKIYDSKEVERRIKEGWVDTPAKLLTTENLKKKINEGGLKELIEQKQEKFDKIIKDAVDIYEKIKIVHLAIIMAQEKCLEDNLRKLCDVFKSETPDLDVSTLDNKARVWLSLLKKWSKSQTLKKEDRLKIIDVDEVGLSDFHEFIEKLNNRLNKHHIEIPLPESLFPKIQNIQDTSQVKEGKEKQEITVFPCKPGTKWEDISITLTSDEMVRIKTPQGEGPFTYHKLGMEDGRKGDSPTMLWALLKLFAKERGFISSQNPKYDPKLPDTAKRLNYHLQKLFGIGESIYATHYKVERRYRTKITFDDKTFS